MVTTAAKKRPSPTPPPTRRLCPAAKRMPLPLIGIARACMIGAMSVVMNLEDTEKELDWNLWTIESMFAMAQLAARDQEGLEENERQATCKAWQLMDCWADQAYSPVLVRILEYADLLAELGPSTLGRYIPVLPQTKLLRRKLSVTLYHLSARYFEPPLNDGFMRLKYLILYFFEFVDEGVRFELPKLHKRRERSGGRDVFGRLLA